MNYCRLPKCKLLLPLRQKTKFVLSSTMALLALRAIASDQIDLTQTQTKPVIYGYNLEYRLKKNGSTQYNALFNELSDNGLIFNLKVTPVKRAARAFTSPDDTSCMFPASKNVVTQHRPDLESFIISSKPVDIVSLRVFTKFDSPVVKDMTELEGKTVAIWNGLDPDVMLAGMNIKVESTRSEPIRVKMLYANRLDAILGFTPDVVLAAQQLGLPDPHFHHELALLRDVGASLVCKKSYQNEKLINDFDNLIDKFKKSGKLREILGPHTEIAP